MNNAAKREQQFNEIRIWDPLIRIFHWALVVSFTVSYLSGDELKQLHVWSGYLITALLVFRVVWGVVGSKHARFNDFLFSSAQVIDYLKSLVSATPRRYLGHNPAGATMVFMLLISLSFTVSTGLLLDSGVGVPNVAGQVLLVKSAWADEDEHSDQEHEMLEEVHEFFANLTLLLVVLHIAGVIVSSRLHQENLIRAMITGNKLRDPRE